MELPKAEFVNILTQAKKRIEQENLVDITKGEDFEYYVFEVIKNVASVNVIHTGKQSFPDIIVGGFGIEVKFSKSNKWQSTGNSIFEGTFRSEVTNDIYLFFGRKTNDKQVKVKYELYEKCLADVKVTHSPRFYIDMELPEDRSILREVGISYDTYRKLPTHEKGITIKKYLKSKLKPGEMVWWMDEGERPAIIKQFRTLGDHERNQLRAELFVLFPEVISTSSAKFEKAQLYLLNHHQVTFSRDLFTAGGQVTLLMNGEYVKGIPAVFGKLYYHAKEIQHYIERTASEELYHYWLENDLVEIEEVKKNKTAVWLKLLDGQKTTLSENLLPSSIYKEGLKNPAK